MNEISSSQSLLNINDSERFMRCELIGKGGFSEVYSALDSRLLRSVALKVLRFDLSNAGDSKRRALRQLRLVSRLQHPGVAQILDAVPTVDGLIVVQTLCEGGSLEERLSTLSVPRSETLTWFQAICDAVAYMHDLGLLHCDLKPSNILFDDSNLPVLIDFDLCRRIDEDAAPIGSSLQGTPKYMAPELLTESAVPNVLTEVYALGVILHDLLSGRNRHTTNLAVASKRAANAETLQLLTCLGVKNTRDWDAIIQKATHSEAGQRYRNVASLITDVENALAGRAIYARRISNYEHVVRWSRRAPLTAGLIIAATVIFVCGTLTSLAAWQQARKVKATLEASQTELQKKIVEVSAAQERLTNLISQSEVELKIALGFESQQRELTKQSVAAEKQAIAEQEKTKSLALGAEEALRKATASSEQLALTQKSAELVNREIKLLDGELDVRHILSDYFAQIRNINEAIADSNWDVAEELLGKTDPACRSVEYRILECSISNRTTRLEAIHLGTLSLPSWKQIPKSGKRYHLEPLTHSIGDGLKRRQCVVERGGNSDLQDSMSYKIIDPALATPLHTLSVFWPSKLTSDDVTVHGFLADGSVVISVGQETSAKISLLLLPTSLSSVRTVPNNTLLDDDRIQEIVASFVGSSTFINGSQRIQTPDTIIAGYHRIEIIGKAVDVHNLKISARGIESTYNKNAWPTFEINGAKWIPEKEKLLDSIESKPLLPMGLNFGASKIDVKTVPGNLDVRFCVKSDMIEFDLLDISAGANDCHIIVDIPPLTVVSEDVAANGLTWSAPWKAEIYAYKEKRKGHPPDISSVIKKPSLASYDIDNVDFVFGNKNTKLLYDGKNEMKELPDDLAIITGNREFTAKPGAYRVESMSDDGIRVWIDEKLTIDNWVMGTKHKFRDVQLSGAHKVRFEYFEHAGASRLMCNIRRIR